MKTSVTTIAPVLLPFLFAFAPGTGIASYARDPIERSSLPHPSPAGFEKQNQPETTVSLHIRTKTLAAAAPASVYVDQPRLANWLESTVTKISNYKNVADGWKGRGTLAPTAQTVDEAIELSAQFATEMPGLVSPMISADDDGSICLYWRDGSMMATVSVYGDGSYAFYAEGYDDPARSDSEPIGEPLPSKLIATMSGAVVASLIAA